ncbi:MAG: O-antigen ligase family protein [Sulfuritalea sp.]|nr:O-antigen ligase family protein [Sulfuritalea sp.]
MNWFWQAWLAAIVFVFPVPHTVALRNVLLLIGVVVLLLGFRRTLPRLAPWLKPAAWCLAALTAWIVFHSAAVAPVPTLAFDQVRADWLMPFVIGAVAAWAAAQLPRGLAAQAVLAALAAHMLWLLEWQFRLWLTIGHWPFKATPFGGYDYQGTLNSFFLALLVADRLAWALARYSPLALGQRSAWVLLLLSLVADLVLQSRNSTVITVSLILAASLALLNARSRHRRIIVIAIGLVALVGAGSLALDGRWQNLRASAALGWSQPTYWVTSGAATCRVTPSGAMVDDSAYFRAAMARQALDFLAERPMGIGFGHDAFGRAIEIKYGRAGLGSSHYGWLDFALGTGLVGLVLVLSGAGIALRHGWKRFRERQDGEALLLTFFIGGYLLRCLLDGHFSGWRLGLFAFICGVLIGSMREKSEYS